MIHKSEIIGIKIIFVIRVSNLIILVEPPAVLGLAQKAIVTVPVDLQLQEKNFGPAF